MKGLIGSGRAVHVPSSLGDYPVMFTCGQYRICLISVRTRTVLLPRYSVVLRRGAASEREVYRGNDTEVATAAFRRYARALGARYTVPDSGDIGLLPMHVAGPLTVATSHGCDVQAMLLPDHRIVLVRCSPVPPDLEAFLRPLAKFIDTTCDEALVAELPAA